MNNIETNSNAQKSLSCFLSSITKKLETLLGVSFASSVSSFSKTDHTKSSFILDSHFISYHKQSSLSFMHLPDLSYVNPYSNN